MPKMVKHTIHLYELPEYMEDEFMVSNYKSDEYSFPYIGSVEVEFEMPEKQEETKEDKLKKIDKNIEAQKKVLSRLKRERDEVALSFYKSL